MLTTPMKKTSPPDSPGRLNGAGRQGGGLQQPYEPSCRHKVCLTQIHMSTEEFLRKVFTSVCNADRRQLQQRFIVPDTHFTAAPQLDKVMATECSKNLKSTNIKDPDIASGCC